MARAGGSTGFFRSLSFRAAIAVAVIAASVTALLLSKRAPPVAARTIEARLELASGDVTLKQGAEWPTVISGVPLPEGAELATGKGARALVRLSDGSAVFLRGDTKIALQKTGVELAQGEMWLDAPASERGGLAHKLGDVNVSAAEAGLSMRRAGGDVTVYVARGLAVVTAPGGRVEVNAGEQATVAGAAPPKVAPLGYWEDWTGGMGDHRPVAGESGSGRIYGIDQEGPAGSPARTLEVSKQAVRAVLRDGLAETEVDQTFANPGGRKVEGWYWFTVPERAVVTSFAVETDGQLVEGEVIEKQEAAARYQAAVRAAHEPALLEWIDGRSYRARIYPVPASGSRRVVLRYLELLGSHAGRFEYVYPLRASDGKKPGSGGAKAEQVTIGEFSLTVDLGSEAAGMPLSTLADAVIEDGGRRVTMRRSGYTPRADFLLEGTLRAKAAPFRVARYSAGGDRADYLMARFVPDVDWASIKELPGDLVVVVDTSASADETARQQKAAAAEAVLRALSPSDHFALVALDSAPVVLYPKDGLAEASEKEIAKALERLAEHATGGATDLGALFDVALGRVHGKDQPAVIYIGDGLATTGEITGEKLAERMRRSLSESRARFFTVAVGAEANHALLRELARMGGGQAFRIDDAEGSTAEVLRLAGAVKTPTITDLAIDLGAGLDEPMLNASGKISRGEEVILLARTHHALPQKATVKGRLGGKDLAREYPIEIAAGVGTALVPRLWAAEKIRRLLGESADFEQHRGKVVELGLDYGLVTPFTSILALESEQAYQQQGIKRRSSPLRGVHLTSLTPAAERDFVLTLLPPSPVAGMGCADEKSASVASERGPARPSPESAVAAPPHVARQEQKADNAPDNMERWAPTAAATAAAAPMAAPTAAPEPPGDVGFDARKSAIAAKPAAHGGRAAPAQQPPPPPGVAANSKNEIDAPPLALAKAAAIPSAAPAASARGRVDRPAQPRVLMPQQACSDSARRPLAERIVIWSNRLRRASTADELIARYEGARATCELPDWRATSALLSLIQAKVRTEGAAESLLAHFAGERETQKFIAHAILRRTVDARVVAVVRRVLFDEGKRWIELDNELAAIASADERIARLRQAMLASPGDPEGEVRLVKLLAEANHKEEALALGRRLRERGFMSPQVALDLGDVLARSGFEDDAIRTYSEIVEFDPASPDSRRLLGDVYLRNRWYPAAYRQYKTLTDIVPTDARAWLRLAAAAAGSGRVDEALRLQRQVSSAEGTPGPDDPRAWARLLSAARLGRLLADPAAPPGQSESVARKLKELQVFSGPAALCILTWEDFTAQLTLASGEAAPAAPAAPGAKPAAAAVPPGEVTDALPVGLTAVLLSAADLDKTRWIVRWRNDPRGRDVAFTLHTMIWDGKTFQVTVRSETLPAKEKELALQR